MDIIQAVQQLRPNTAWNLRGDILEQANDGSPRVTIPTQKEIDSVITNTIEAPVLSLEDRIAILEDKLADK